MNKEWFFHQVRRSELKPIRQRAFAATPGPWRWAGKSKEEWPQGENSLIATDASPGRACILSGWGYDASGIECANPNDAAFIEHAREDIPNLLLLLRGMAAAMVRLADEPTPDCCAALKREALDLLDVLNAADRLIPVEIEPVPDPETDR